MGEVMNLIDSFGLGVKRDHSRDQIPRGALWWAEDMLPNIGARLRERGGWENFSADIAATVATSSYVVAGITPPGWSGIHVVIDEDGRVIKLASDGVVTDVAAGVVPSQNPVFHRDMVIVPGSTVKKVTNSAGTLTVANLGGSPPAASYATVFNDRTLLARTDAAKNTLYFSDPGDPETWDTTNSLWEFSNDITGLASLKNAILVFHEAFVSRLHGSSPPPGGDFYAMDPMASVGCTDARSIAYWNDRVIFANAEGIHVTDGAATDDLTARCGMTRYWQDTFNAYSSTWTIVGQVIRDHYMLTVMDGATFKAAAFIDLRRFAYWPMTNIDMRSAWVAQGAADELYFGRRGAARVGKISPVFSPDSDVKNDGDGDAVTGLVETPFFVGQDTMKGFRRLFVNHYLRDYGSDDPTVLVEYVKSLESTSYTTAETFSENTLTDRQIAELGFSARGIGLRLTRANAGDWQLNRIGADVHSREPSR